MRKGGASNFERWTRAEFMFRKCFVNLTKITNQSSTATEIQAHGRKANTKIQHWIMIERILTSKIHESLVIKLSVSETTTAGRAKTCLLHSHRNAQHLGHRQWILRLQVTCLLLRLTRLQIFKYVIHFQSDPNFKFVIHFQSDHQYLFVQVVQIM